MTSPFNDISVVTVGVPGQMPLDDTTQVSIITEAPDAAQTIVVNIPGIQGPPGVFRLGPVATGTPGSEASVVQSTDEDGVAVLNLTVPRGDVGPQGPANVLALGAVTTGAPDAPASVTITGTSPNQIINFTIPKGVQGAPGIQGIPGSQGIQGVQGPQGPQGPAGVNGQDGKGISVAGQVATYSALPTNLTSADSGKAYIVSADGKLYIWSGTAFPANGAGNTFVGPAGPSTNLTIGTVTSGAPGSAATATVTGTSPNQTLNLTIPTGATGAQGPAGPANNLSIGTVTTVAAGAQAAATITGAAPSQVLNLTLPSGPGGPAGNGVLFLGASDPVPANTPLNTVIFRPNTKTGTYYWGSGTSFPSSGMAAGDTYFHSGINCMFVYNGFNWRQQTVPTFASWSAIQSMTSSYSGSLHTGLRVINYDSTGNTTNMFGVASPSFVPNGNTFQWNGTTWEYIGGGQNPTTSFISLGTNWSQFGSGWSSGTASLIQPGVVSLNGLLKLNVAATAGTSYIAGTIPTQYRPLGVTVLTWQTVNADRCRMDVLPNGTLNVIPQVGAGAGSWYTMNAVYTITG